MLWKLVRSKDETKKIPFLAGDRYAKCNDPKDWMSFRKALRWHKLGESNGISFGLTQDDGYCGVDLDDCRCPTTGKIEDWAQRIIDSMCTYTEFSPSGTGIRMIGKACLGRGIAAKAGQGKIEVYDRERFLTITGCRLNGNPICDIQQQVERIKHWCESKRKRHPAIQKDIAAPANIATRARRLAETMEPAVSGSGGHTTFYKAAIALVKGLGLSIDEAHPHMMQYNARCVPPFSDYDVERKLRDAQNSSVENGYLLQ